MRKMFPPSWRARCNGADPFLKARLFGKSLQRIPIIDLLFLKRLRNKKPGFVHPAQATGRDPGNSRIPLPSLPLDQPIKVPNCANVDCVKRLFKSAAWHQAFGSASAHAQTMIQ
mmetsp:Transcript_18019/g.43100  ORF Transcript_18019/g.43100 Transcript_18019/m.43100 type:complete len:114 (-) Transcript_18019:6-347(-)